MSTENKRETMLKVCNKCNESKENGDFYKNRSDCKACRSEYKRKYHRVNWAKRIVHTSKSNDERARRTSTDLEYVTEQRVKDIAVMQRMACYYCATVMKVDVDRRKNPDAVTIERIENTLPHWLENCVLACSGCNYSRQDTYTFDEFKENFAQIKTGAIKRCSDCGTIKERSEFYSNKTRKHGVRSICKSCIVARRRMRRAKKRKLLAQ